MLISAFNLIQSLRIAVNTVPDQRSDIHCRYTMDDLMLGAFSVFLTQSPSFLSFQRTMQEQTGRNNGTSLFGIQSLPGDDQIRRVLDSVAPELLYPVFTTCVTALLESGAITEFKSDLGYLIALDGTQYFSSNSMHCANCLTKTDRKTGMVTYSHTAITPVVVQPGSEHVLSLVPEYIVPQDGHAKQDCEHVAAKRWMRRWGSMYATRLMQRGAAVLFLGDDLYSRQPVIETFPKGTSYILVCKRESHPWLTMLLISKKEQMTRHCISRQRGAGTAQPISSQPIGLPIIFPSKTIHTACW